LVVNKGKILTKNNLLLNLLKGRFTMALGKKIKKSLTNKNTGVASKKTSSAKAKTTVAKEKKVKFSITAPNASKVSLAGSFNNWSDKKTPLKKNTKKQWEKEVPLKPGSYEYKFVVDGNWINDPANDNLAWNDFGTQNSIINI